MKKNKTIIEILLLGLLALFSIVSIAPKAFVMPSSAQMILLIVASSLVALVLVFFWRENPRDEREVHNQAVASRAAYTVGAAILIVGLVVQGVRHELDPFIPLALLAMIGTKVFIQRTKDDE